MDLPELGPKEFWRVRVRDGYSADGYSVYSDTITVELRVKKGLFGNSRSIYHEHCPNNQSHIESTARNIIEMRESAESRQSLLGDYHTKETKVRWKN